MKRDAEELVITESLDDFAARLRAQGVKRFALPVVTDSGRVVVEGELEAVMVAAKRLTETVD